MSVMKASYEITYRYLMFGSGPPVLMVPGGSGDAVLFAPLLAHPNNPAECGRVIRDFLAAATPRTIPAPAHGS